MTYYRIFLGSDAATRTEMPLFVQVIREACVIAHRAGDDNFGSPSYVGPGSGYIRYREYGFIEVYEHFVVLCNGGSAMILPLTPFGYVTIRWACEKLGVG